MADPVAKALEDINRTLKDLLQVQRDQLRAQKAINHNLLILFSKSGDTVEDAPPEEGPKDLPSYIPSVYGWSMANVVQREGGLKVGDQKIMDDDSRWTWNGDIWERTDEPSAREPD